MADFNYRINRQGPRGPQGLQGEKGDPGNTFTVSEGVNTPTEYTLIFDGGDGNQFETDNLRNPIVDRGGTYVRYDRDNVVQYIGEPDMAVIDGTPGIVNLAGKDTVTPNASDAVAYELLEKTVDELNTALEGLDDRLDTDEGDISQAKSDIVNLDNRVTTNEGNITSLQSGKADKSTTYTKTEVNNALAGKANTVHTHTVSQITNAGALASQNTVDYQTQVTNKPTIPTVGNGTITLTQGGVTKGTFTTNQSGNSTIDLDAGGGSQLTAGNAINISDDVISVKYDGTTIGLNASGQLQSLVEEPDMTQYYTKSQVDNLIPDVSGFASSIDVGTMFTGATETKEDNVKLDVANSYQNTAGGVQFVDNKYYLNWDNNTNNGFYAVPKTANETIPIMNVCVYKTTSVEDPNTKQTTTTTVPFMYVSDWLNSTGNRNVTAYTEDTYSFGTDTTTPKGMMDEEQYQAIQDLQNAGWNIFYKDNGLFQKVYSIVPSSVTGFYDFSLETIGYNFPLVDSTTGGINNYTFYMGWQQTAPTVAMHIRNTDNYSTTGMIFVSINITKTDLDNTLNPTTGVTPDYEWENTRFAQYTDYATTQTAGLVKVGNNLSIAADGTLSADTQAPTAGAGVSVNGTAVSVNVDNSTITINGSGELVANIPTPATVDQTYDATSTNAQSGVAIAGAGFLNGSIVQSPLEYLPDTTGSLTYQNVNTSTMVGSGTGVVVASGLSSATSPYGIRVYTSNNTYTDLLAASDKTALINNSSLTWFETALSNGINFTCKTQTRGTQEYNYTYVLGHYENGNFIPDAAASVDNFYGIIAIISTGNKYATDVSYGTSACSFYLSGTSLIVATEDGVSNPQDKRTRTITSSEADILNAVTHIRVYRSSGSTINLALSDIKVVNPTSATPVTDGDGATRYALFTNGTNIFDAHPESLSLKYDSTTLGVNSSGQLYAQSSAPSNYVTTDTQQIITGRKDMAIINIQPSGSTGYLNYITPISSGKIAISKSTSYDTAGTQPGILLDFSNSAAITSVAYGGNANYINMCTQYGNNTAEIRFCNGYKAGQVGSSHAGIGKYGDYTYIRNNNTNDKKVYKITTGGATSSDFTNFFLEKDMLDGTTISYDSTTGKISTVGSFVPTTRTINTKALSSDITLTAEDLGTLPVSDDLKEVVTINYTIVGSPTISSDYELTNTSLSDYLTIAELPLRTASQAVSHSYKFEAQFIPNTSTPVQNEAIFDRFQDSDGIRLIMTDAGKVRFRTIMNNLTADTDFTFSNTTVVVGTLYKVVAEIAAGASTGTLTLYSSSDNGVTWITEETGTLGSNTPFAKGSSTNTKHYIGLNGYGPSAPYNGTILLDKMLFYEDDVLVWTPVEIVQGITEIGKASETTYGLVTKNHPMPGDSYDSITVGASGATYNMTNTGWLCFDFGVKANNQYLEVSRTINNTNILLFRNQLYGTTSSSIACMIPVKKGDIIAVNYNVTGTKLMYFIPAIL